MTDQTHSSQGGESVAMEAEIAALTKALTGLTCGGSEFFIRKGDRYVADIPACVAHVNRCKEDAHSRTVRAITESQRLAKRLAAIAEFVDNYFAPWGAWKTAWWEDAVSDDAAYCAENALKAIANLARAPTTNANQDRGEG